MHGHWLWHTRTLGVLVGGDLRADLDAALRCPRSPLRRLVDCQRWFWTAHLQHHLRSACAWALTQHSNRGNHGDTSSNRSLHLHGECERPRTARSICFGTVFDHHCSSSRSDGIFTAPTSWYSSHPFTQWRSAPTANSEKAFSRTTLSHRGLCRGVNHCGQERQERE